VSSRASSDRAPALAIEPVTADRWSELAEFFGRAGAYSGCWCTWWRVTSSEFTAGCRDGAVGNRDRMARLTAEGEVPGLLAFDDGRPVGWVSLGPRPGFGRVLRSPVLRPERGGQLNGVPDPDDDPDDPDVWSVVCFWVPRAERGRGVATALLDGAVRRATGAGARTLEAYPVAGEGRQAAAQIYTGTLGMFSRAGFTEVRRRRPARPVVRRRLG
jgi:GNAT superfamily N-acetyltransferase